MRDPDQPGGPVDGAWWPRTADPASELNELTIALIPLMGHMIRIGFDWAAANPDRYGKGATTRAAPALAVMYLYGPNGTRLDVLVIPAQTPARIAARQMFWASGTTWTLPPSTAG
ncbi:DUF5994 family protein [Nocardia sp. NPDC127526]|uniref:DUF5994 family protein n=1 Tax=Nocardia sp. NPDC127526 TaxID=3345393 RepID=UPI00362DA5BF